MLFHAPSIKVANHVGAILVRNLQYKARSS